jgi:hypothetical protein
MHFVGRFRKLALATIIISGFVLAVGGAVASAQGARPREVYATIF